MAEAHLLNLIGLLWSVLLGLLLPLGVGRMAVSIHRGEEKRTAGRLLLAGLLILPLSLVAGFSLQYGAIHLPQLGEPPHTAWQWAPWGEGSGLLAWAGPGVPPTPGRMALLLLQVVGASVVVLIALAPLRCLPTPALVGCTVVIGGLLYPLWGHWVWGGGWLAAVGRSAYLGHGVVDWGGAGRYALGGLLALSGLLALHRRGRPPEADPQPPQSPSLGGTFLTLLGIAGLNLAGAWGVGPQLPLVALNTWAGAAAGGLVALLYMAFVTARPQSGMAGRGLVAGAAASAALAPFAPPTTLLLVGAAAGLLTILATFFLQKFADLEDPTGTTLPFAIGGLWGLLAVGLFADGRFGQGWNGVGAGRYLGIAGQGVGGIALLAPGRAADYGQLTAQLLGCSLLLLLGLGLGWLLFRLSMAQPVEEDL